MKKLFVSIIFIFAPMIVYASDITSSSKILVNDNKLGKLVDNNENSYSVIDKGNDIIISNEEDIYGIYIIYELKSIEGKISNDVKEETIGSNGFLHEYIDVSKLIGAAKEIKLNYKDDVKIGEIYVFNKGELPEYVEIWNEPCEEADLLLFSTHSDDEQLFFAGLMPYYVSLGAKVQVVYFTNHFDNPKRLHEQIHGLYTVGIRNYPIIGFIPDAWSDNLNWAIKNMNKAGYSEDDAIKFEVEMIRRFKPLVVVGHDENGEYSHGQHMLNTHVLKSAILLTNNSEYDNNSALKYGLWDTPKTYLHLYKENKITMNYDEPLDYFGGKTAYEVSKEGYSKHLSQQYTWFTKWLTGVNDKGVGTPYTKASQITKYSPCEFGLFKTTVGEDNLKNDMFENLTLRKDEVIDISNEEIDENENKQIVNKKEDNNNKYYYKYIGIGLIVFILLIAILKKKKN